MSLAIENTPDFEAPAFPETETFQAIGEQALAPVIELPRKLAPGMAFTNAVVAAHYRANREFPHFGSYQTED